jgi:fumarate reductase flavoprotein subunit
MNGNFDVVVIGGGLAGLVAASRAAQLGKRVVVLERGSEARYPCNSRWTGGVIHICRGDIMASPADHIRHIAETTEDYVAGDLARMLAEGAAPVMQWLQSEGGKFIRGNPATQQNWVMAPPTSRTRPGLEWEGRGGDALLAALESKLRSRGGQLVRGARARSLIMQERGCAGATAEINGASQSFPASATIIADGGFQGNTTLIGKMITRHPERLKQRGAGTGTGDGLQMAEEAGAAVIGLDRFYGHVLSLDAMENDALWPYPYLDSLLEAGIVVDAAGRRFVDEGKGGVFVANAIAGLDDPSSSFVVFDKAIWEGPGRGRHVPPNPHLPQAGGTIFQAGDLDDLARQMRVPADTLHATVATYNQALAGDTAGPAPGRSRRKQAFPIAIAPFYAAPVCAGITNTMGGIVVDAAARVLTGHGAPIAGLFAVGGSAGGLEGGPAIGYVGGLSKAAITGFMAAESIGRG